MAERQKNDVVCDFSLQNQGLGKKFLSMLISALLGEYGYERVVDTNVKISARNTFMIDLDSAELA